MFLNRVATACAIFSLGLVQVILAAEPNPFGFPQAGDPGGGLGAVRVWYTNGEWHLRTSTENSVGKKDKLMVFSGSIVGDDKITLEGSKLEKKGKKGDTLTPHANGKGFDFEFKTYGAVDEVIFKTAATGKSLKFKLLIDGEKAATQRILIGEKGSHPVSNEFSLPAQPKPR